MVDGIRRRVANAIKLVYPRFGLRDSDVLLASYPKSGNTWVRFIWANMISLMEMDGRKIDFKIINTEMVAEYDSHSYGSLELETLPRFVKTHKRYIPAAFGSNRCVYIVRHPGDVLVSYFEYRKAQKSIRETASDLGEFIRNEEHGMSAWCNHVSDWVPNSDAILRYEDLKFDTVVAIERTLRKIGIDSVPGKVVDEAVERSSFDSMRRAEEKRGRLREDRFESGYKFMRKGATGEWKERLKKPDIEYLKKKISEHNIEVTYSL